MMKKRKIERSVFLAVIAMGMIFAPPACAGTGDDNDASYPEFGVEYKQYYLAGNNQPSSPTSAAGFRNALLSAGWTESFFIGDENRNPNRWTYSGVDQSYVDGTDMVYFTGHGWNQGILLNSLPGNYVYFRNCEWGDYDAEWILLDGCHTVQLPSELKYYPHYAMNGVHLVCGFDSVGYDLPDDGANVANKLVDGYKVRLAWFNGIDENHGSEIRVGIIGENADCGNDHIWKEGSVIADPPVDSEIYRWLYNCN